LFVVTFCNLQLLAQSIEVAIKGRIYDGESKESLVGATVTCLFAKDSSRAVVGITDKNGEFLLNELSEDFYYLNVTYIGYKPVVFPVRMKLSRGVNYIGDISMLRSDVKLVGISVVGSEAAVRITRDTMEFRSSYYHMREHSVLGDLLRRIPGIQIAQDGTIRINGEIVKSIMVDGKSFFINDPKVALRNLHVDMVDKVQLINRKAKGGDIFSGENSPTEKVINITIKKDRQNAWDGEIMGGFAIGDRFAMKANINRFRDVDQIAIFTSGDNVNGYLEGLEGNAGISRKLTHSLNYSRSINDKVGFNASYIIQDLNVDESKTSFQKSYIDDTNYYYNQRYKQLSETKIYNLNTKWDIKLDSNWTLSIVNNFGLSKASNLMTNYHVSYGDRSQMLDTGWLTNRASRNGSSFSNSVFIERQFNSDGHRLGVMLSYTNYISRERNYNLSNTSFLTNQGRYWDTLNTLGAVFNKPKTLQLAITHSIKILPKVSLVSSYGLVRSYNHYDFTTTDFNYLDNKYDRPIDSLSAGFSSTFVSNIFRIGISSAGEKFEYGVSLNASRISYNTCYSNIKGDVKLLNWVFLPTSYLGYNFNNGRRVRFSFAASSVLPTVEQMRPVPDYSNPLVIKYGNPNINIGKVNTYSLSYNALNSVTMKYFSVSANGSFFKNQIINGIWIDSLKRQVIQPVNITGSYSIGINIESNFPLKKQRSTINASSAVNFARNMSIANGFEGYGQSISFSQSLSYIYSYKDLLSIMTGTGISYYKVRYSDQDNNIRGYFTYSFTLDFNAKMPLGLSAGVGFGYSIYGGRGGDFNSSLPMLNANISKQLFSNHNGAIRLSAFDILKSNLSINRNIGSNFIEDVKINVLQRFFMVSFIYYIKGK